MTESAGTAIMQARERDLERSATDASHVAFEHRQVVGDIKAISPSANGGL
jgi:hypothetical protein